MCARYPEIPDIKFRQELGFGPIVNWFGPAPVLLAMMLPGWVRGFVVSTFVEGMGWLIRCIVNVGKASHQADIVSIKDEMATVKWKTWKGHAEVEVNQLRLICDGSKRKRKQTDQFGQPTGDMTDADTTKKLKPAATIPRSESLKDLSTLVCNVCHGDVWCKNDRWIGGYCVEKKVHVCSYCKKLAMQKQARLAKGGSVNKYMIWDPSSDE